MRLFFGMGGLRPAVQFLNARTGMVRHPLEDAAHMGHRLVPVHTVQLFTPQTFGQTKGDLLDLPRRQTGLTLDVRLVLPQKSGALLWLLLHRNFCRLERL